MPASQKSTPIFVRIRDWIAMRRIEIQKSRTKFEKGKPDEDFEVGKNQVGEKGVPVFRECNSCLDPSRNRNVTNKI